MYKIDVFARGGVRSKMEHDTLESYEIWGEDTEWASEGGG